MKAFRKLSSRHILFDVDLDLDLDLNLKKSILSLLNHNANASYARLDQPGSSRSRSRPPSTSVDRCKRTERGRHCSKTRRRKPARRCQLVARSIVRSTNRPQREAAKETKKSKKFTKRLERRLEKKRNLLKRIQDTPSFNLPARATVQDVIRSKDASALELPTEHFKASTSLDASSTQTFYLKSHYDIHTSPLSRKGKRKRKNRKPRRRDISEEENNQKDEPPIKISPIKPLKTKTKRKPTIPTQGALSELDEWPSLAEVSGKLENKKVSQGNGKPNKEMEARHRQQLWAQVAAPSTSSACSGRTWARVASGSLRPLQQGRQGESSKQTAEHPNIPADRESQPDSSFPMSEKTLGRCQKGSGKMQSIKFLRKHYGGAVSVKRRVHSVRSINKTKDSKIQNRKDTGPNITGTLYQDEKATSRNTNGEQDWCIDNMSIVYTKPASKVICLDEPKRQTRKKRRRKGMNRCNHRSLSPHSSIHTFFAGDLIEPPKPGSLSGSKSENELSMLLSNVSVHSRGSSDKVASTSHTLKQQSNHKLPPHLRYWKQKRQETLDNAEDTVANETKKVAVRYRALQRKDGSRMDVKAMAEHQTRIRRSDTIKETKVCTRSSQRRLRRYRQEEQRSVQRSPAKNVGSILTHLTTTPPLPTPPCHVTLDLSEGTSVEFESTSDWTSDQEIEASRTQKKLKTKHEENKGTNNSVLTALALTHLLPGPSSSRQSESKNIPVQTNSDPLLSVDSQLSVTSDHVDLDWWKAYLECSEASACELVPLPDNMSVNECLSLMCPSLPGSARSC